MPLRRGEFGVRRDDGGPGRCSTAALSSSPSRAARARRERRSPMRMRHWIVLFAVVAGAACLPAVSRAEASVDRVALSFTSGDMCGVDGEPVALTGRMIVAHTFVDMGDGVYHERDVAQLHMTGFGLVSGDRYIFNASGQVSEMTFDNRPAIVIDTSQAVMIHAGETTPLDDFYLRMSLHTPGGVYVDESGCR